MKKLKPFFIGICGPSTSGKSTLSNSLKKELNAEVINMDNFFKKEITEKLGGHINLEHPKSLMIKRLIKCLTDLKNGKETLVPSRKFTERFDKLITPNKIIIVEGFLLFYKKNLSDFFNLRLFLDLLMEKLIDRRVNYAGKEEEKYSKEVVIPEHLRYRKRMISNSDYVLNGNKSKLQIKKETLFILSSLINKKRRLDLILMGLLQNQENFKRKFQKCLLEKKFLRLAEGKMPKL